MPVGLQMVYDIMLYTLLPVNIPTLQDNYLQQAGHPHTVFTNVKLLEMKYNLLDMASGVT